MAVARLKTKKLILIVSLKAYTKGPTKAPFKVNLVLLFQPCPTSPPVSRSPTESISWHQPLGELCARRLGNIPNGKGKGKGGIRKKKVWLGSYIKAPPFLNQ
ncbi:hypothetical protein FF1_006946 [Malus domestica]